MMHVCMVPIIKYKEFMYCDSKQKTLYSHAGETNCDLSLAKSGEECVKSHDSCKCGCPKSQNLNQGDIYEKSLLYFKKDTNANLI